MASFVVHKSEVQVKDHHVVDALGFLLLSKSISDLLWQAAGDPDSDCVCHFHSTENPRFPQKESRKTGAD